jgi:hypothetical protein
MQALKDYVDQKNAWGKIFGSTPLKLDNAKDRQRIAEAIDAELSPENLHCDGEISRSAAMAKYRKLATVARQLQKLDSSVRFYEL